MIEGKEHRLVILQEQLEVLCLLFYRQTEPRFNVLFFTVFVNFKYQMSSEHRFSEGFDAEFSDVTTYCVLRIFPFAIFLTLNLTSQYQSTLIGVVLLILQIYLIFYIKNKLSLKLVGLTWYFDTEKTPNFPFIHRFVKPRPYLSKQSNSNYFWLIGFANIVSWLIVCFISLFKDFLTLFLSVSCLLLNSLDFWLFLSCHALSKKQSKELTKSVLLSASYEFENAEETMNEETEEETGESYH